MVTPFDILGVQANADPEVVDAAYRALMKKHHPDRRGAAADASRAQQINAAYAAIKSGAHVATTAAATAWEPPQVTITPPLRVERRLAWAMLASLVLLGIMAAIATS